MKFLLILYVLSLSAYANEWQVPIITQDKAGNTKILNISESDFINTQKKYYFEAQSKLKQKLRTLHANIKEWELHEIGISIGLTGEATLGAHGMGATTRQKFYFVRREK